MPTPPCSGNPVTIYPDYQHAYLKFNPKLRWGGGSLRSGAETNFLRNALHFEGVYYKKKPKTCWRSAGVSQAPCGIKYGSIENSGVESLPWLARQDRRLELQHRNEPCHHQEQALGLVQEGYPSWRQAAELHKWQSWPLHGLQGGRRLPDPGGD